MPACPVHTYPSAAPRSLHLDPVMQHIADGPGIARLQLPHGDPCWIVTRYDDVRTVYLSKNFTRTGMATIRSTGSVRPARPTPLRQRPPSLMGHHASFRITERTRPNRYLY